MRTFGPAASAGLRPGDLVLALDGKAMENGRQFHVGLYRRTVGDAITLDVQRGDLTWKVPVSIAERHDPLGDLASSIDPRENLVPRLGVLAPGDIVYAVNRTAIAGLDGFCAALDGLKVGDPVVLQLERDGEPMYLTFTIE